MKNASVTYSIIQLSKKIKKYGTEEEYEMFPGADEINLELAALEEHMAERMDELV